MWPTPYQHHLALLSSTSRCLISWFSCSNLEIVCRTSSLAYSERRKSNGMSLVLINKWAPSGKENGLIESDLSNRPVWLTALHFSESPPFLCHLTSHQETQSTQFQAHHLQKYQNYAAFAWTLQLLLLNIRLVRFSGSASPFTSNTVMLISLSPTCMRIRSSFFSANTRVCDSLNCLFP